MAAQTWGYKNDIGNWTEADPFAGTGTSSSGSSGQASSGSSSSSKDSVDFPLETYKAAADVAYSYSKKKMEDTRAQQQALNTQAQEYKQQDQARDYQQANQAYRY